MGWIGKNRAKNIVLDYLGRIDFFLGHHLSIGDWKGMVHEPQFSGSSDSARRSIANFRLGFFRIPYFDPKISKITVGI